MTTFGDRVYQYGGIPVDSGDTSSPIFGNVYFVDGTNGAAGNDGGTPSTAMTTVTAAITLQTAETGSLGDVIYVMPGDYVESITGNLASVQIIGAGFCGIAGAVAITPSDGNAYVGNMSKSAFKNMCFKQASSTNQDYGYVTVPSMQYSVIDNCLFLGVADTEKGSAFRIGAETEAANEHMAWSAFTNNTITTGGSRLWEEWYPIMFGEYSAGADTYSSTRQFLASRISHNTIMGEVSGIVLQAGSSNCGGSVISHNVITSNQGQMGGAAVHSAHGVTDLLCTVARNTLRSALGITGFSDANTLWNVHSIDGTPIMDLPDTT